VSPDAAAGGVLEAAAVDALDVGDVTAGDGVAETGAAEHPTVPESNATSPMVHTDRLRITDTPLFGA
jgi:hypothetical protein